MSDSSDSFPETSPHERRLQFRVDDTAILDVIPVSEGQASAQPAQSFFKPSGSFNLTRELHEIEQEHQGTLRVITERYTDIGIYLNVLNKKLDIIGGAVAESILPEEQSLQSIDLSEGGIGFGYHEKLEPRSLHAMKIWFHQARVGIYAFINIVASNRAIDGGIHVSASFYRLPDTERKIIARHIMALQAEQQRNRKARKQEN